MKQPIMRSTAKSSPAREESSMAAKDNTKEAKTDSAWWLHSGCMLRESNRKDKEKTVMGAANPVFDPTQNSGLAYHEETTELDNRNSSKLNRKKSLVTLAFSLVVLPVWGAHIDSAKLRINRSITIGAAQIQPQSTLPTPPIVIDAGTILTVTIDKSVSTKTSNSGDRFEASIAEPVTINGDEILSRGTKASGTVTQSKSAGHMKGGAVRALTLDSVTVHGRTYSIETSSFEEIGKGRGKRTAVGAGGGAAFGAIVGALAGGGKGAAIGALAGGGAGTAGTAFTGKRDFTIPAESRLHFKLRRSLELTPIK